ncbi:hypothetical protein V1478_014991 [Vespula squamosa]|uniref:Uncharacterized protein n=1 Tax=Vespula squamosa TaxID=30214 RepID=A0ABD2A3T4_VESSQ
MMFEISIKKIRLSLKNIHNSTGEFILIGRSTLRIRSASFKVMPVRRLVAACRAPFSPPPALRAAS